MCSQMAEDGDGDGLSGVLCRDTTFGFFRRWYWCQEASLLFEVLELSLWLFALVAMLVCDSNTLRYFGATRRGSKLTTGPLCPEESLVPEARCTATR